MLIFDVETLRILEVNDAAIAQYGYVKEEFVALTIREMRVPSESLFFDTLVPKFSKPGNLFVEGQHMLKSGKTISVQIVSYIIDYKQRKCRLAHIHDVTAVVKQNRNLEILLSIGKSVSEELELESILQKVIDATTQLCGAEFGLFLYKNSLKNRGNDMLFAHASVNGHSGEWGKKGASFTQLISSDVVRMADVKENLHFRKVIASLKLSEKEQVPISSYLSVPVSTKSKEVIGCLFFSHSQADIFTEEAEKMVLGVVSQAIVALDNAVLFEALVAANKEKGDLLQKATEQNFKKDEFLSVASHELKTPVTSMKGYLQILEKQVARGNHTSYPDLIQKANKQVNKIVHLVSELLNLSKLEAGKLEYNFSSFTIADILTDIIANMKNAEVKHSIKIFGDTDCVIFGDKNRLEQVIINLIDNAIKYSPDANEVLLGLSEEDGNFKMEVRDFGPGIAEDKLPLIFERYYRGEENSYKTSGLGLGLFISSEIIKRHNGHIGVESELGKGSTFWFVIPMQ